MRLANNLVIKCLVLYDCLAMLVLLAIAKIEGRQWFRSRSTQCANNLKEIELGALMWANEHEHPEFPWHLPARSNGLSEVAISGDVASVFRSLTNYMKSANVLTCPSDSRRKPESNFTKLNNTNISYFIALDREDRKPVRSQIGWDCGHAEPILFGDRNFSGGILNSNRVMEVLTTNVSWGKDIHVRSGNLGMSDGSVLYLDNAALREEMTYHLGIIESGPDRKARFAIP